MFGRRKKSKNNGIEDNKVAPKSNEQILANQISYLGTELIKGSNDKRTSGIILMEVPVDDKKTVGYAICGGEEMAIVALLCNIAKKDESFRMVLSKAAALIDSVGLDNIDRLAKDPNIEKFDDIPDEIKDQISKALRNKLGIPSSDDSAQSNKRRSLFDKKDFDDSLDEFE
jgi:hypothetical protein